MKEQEFPLSLSDQVYIGNRPAEPGIYDRYWITEIDGKQHIILRRLDCTTEEFNPQITPVFLECRPRHRYHTDTTVEDTDNVFDTNIWSRDNKVLAPDLDKYCSDMFKSKLPGIDIFNNENFTLLTADSLKEMDRPGVYLNNCGQKDYFPAGRLIYILVDHIHQQLVICRKGSGDRSYYSTFSLSKITSIRSSPTNK